MDVFGGDKSEDTGPGDTTRALATATATSAPSIQRMKGRRKRPMDHLSSNASLDFVVGSAEVQVQGRAQDGELGGETIRARRSDVWGR